MKRNIIIGSLALLAFTCSIVAVAAKADFSGTWTMDKSRTEGLPPGMEATMTVRHTGDTINAETKVTTAQGNQTITATYVLDGKEMEYKASRQGMEGKGKRTSRWSADGNGFEVNEEERFSTPQGEAVYQFARRWSMLPDGKTLAIVIDIKNPNGSATI